MLDKIPILYEDIISHNAFPFGVFDPYDRIHTYVVASMGKTVKSILELKDSKRIGDAYALLRKYYEAVILDVFIMTKDKEKFEAGSKIYEWIKNKQEMFTHTNPSKKVDQIRKMSEKIAVKPQTIDITKILKIDNYPNSEYKNIRNRCNSHIHHVDYEKIILNDPNLFSYTQRDELITELEEDLKNIFILHISYLSILKTRVLIDVSDLDAGLPMIEEKVEPLVKTLFEEIIKPSSFSSVISVIEKETGLKFVL